MDVGLKAPVGKMDMSCRSFEQEMEQILSATQGLKVSTDGKAPISTVSVYKLSLIAAIDYQIAIAHDINPRPTMNVLLSERFAQVHDKRALFLQKSQDGLKWDFDRNLRRATDKKLARTRQEASVQVGGPFWPDFTLAESAVDKALDICRAMGLGVE